MGSDRTVLFLSGPWRISIHAPRVGSDIPAIANSIRYAGFQSTLPVWGATRSRDQQEDMGMISIHAPRVGSDPEIYPTNHRLEIFQSTLPVWGATRYAGKTGKVNDKISIHAPRVGSDKCGLEAAAQNHHFNPRSPCGERRVRQKNQGYVGKFQSTLPVWGATPGRPRGTASCERFQSTLPVWGATAKTQTMERR